jgi:hypothetical protein
MKSAHAELLPPADLAGGAFWPSHRPDAGVYRTAFRVRVPSRTKVGDRFRTAGPRWSASMTWSYQLEYGKTSAQPHFSARLQRHTRSAVVKPGGNGHPRVPGPREPRRGKRHARLRHASPPLAPRRRELQSRHLRRFLYRQALGIFVTRFRAGAVLEPRTRPTIPLTERLYARA